MMKTTPFGALPPEYCRADTAKIVVVPVPYDETSTWMKGADKGPQALLRASANMELYDIETDSQVYEEGIFTDDPVDDGPSPDRMVRAVEQRVSRHLANGKFTVVVGGEHSVSIGAIQAHARKYPASMTVLQLDAHADLRAEYEGSRYNHACVMARARELCRVVQVGIRSMDISEKPALDPQRVFFAQALHEGVAGVEDIVGRLTDSVYITIDLDVFDPSIMPATGTPEPGGLLWYDVLALLKAVCRRRTVVGFDLVELCPVETNWGPDFLAAKLLYKLLSYRFRGGYEEGRDSPRADRPH
ncbi:MAG: agmatinase [Planctomycetes bacterium RBG_13_62_9]|nr:MAG: agmatinase [Planctomycetes bacterium RBG_13_62_9]